jgi:hypothetical protein
VAALVRPPDAAHGEDEESWVERARQAASRGPFGLHTHWTAPDHARPTTGDPAALVREQGMRLRQLGLTPTLFCGGGWYWDVAVGEACAELGYVDCTGTAYAPSYLSPGAPRLALARPSRLQLPSGNVLTCVPATHSLGMVARAVLLPSGLREDVVHVHFHDTDLLHRPRRLALIWSLRALALRRSPTDPDAVAVARGDATPVAIEGNGVPAT